MPITRYFNDILLATMLLIAASLTIFAPASSTDDLQGYKPVYSLGTGDADWWINYPDNSLSPGTQVSHLPWVIDDLKQKPVVIFVYRLDCMACEVQKEDLNKVLDSYGNDVKYYDLLVPNEKMSGILTSYFSRKTLPTVPITVVLTTIKGSDGKNSVAWHTMYDAEGEEIVASYVKDAIYYYRQSSV
jgi:hypothetical protein